MENGMLTPIRKLCRPALLARYRGAIEQLQKRVSERVNTLHQSIEKLLRQAVAPPASGAPAAGTAAAAATDAPLQSLGLDSITAVRLAASLSEQYGQTIPVQLLYSPNPAAAIAQLLGHRAPGAVAATASSSSAFVAAASSVGRLTRIDWQSECKLPADIRAASTPTPATAGTSAAAGAPDAIFLTGATGFLGVYLLDELLKQTATTGMTVLCLLRGAGSGAGTDDDSTKTKLESRLLNHMRLHRLASAPSSSAADGSTNKRWEVVVGDLERPQFGLSADAYARLAARTAWIVHCGAIVNGILPYSALKAANVGGTIEVLRLACHGNRVRPVHHISTTGIVTIGSAPVSDSGSSKQDTGTKGAASKDAKTALLSEAESNALFATRDLDRLSGYQQSKWIAEQLVREACSARGIPCTMYRPSTIGPHRVTGCANSQDFVCRVLCGLAQLGLVPDVPTQQVLFDLVAVDDVARDAVRLMCTPTPMSSTPTVYHFSNSDAPVALQQLVDACRSKGYGAKVVLHAEWYAALCRAPSNVLFPLSSLLSTALKATVVPIDCRGTRAALAMLAPPTAASAPQTSTSAASTEVPRMLTAALDFFVGARFIPAAACA